MDLRRLLPIPLLLHALYVLPALALLAGCGGGGGGSAKEYEAGLQRVQKHLQEASDASRASGETTDVEERRAKLGAAHDSIAAAARVASGLEPPQDARAPHRRFAEALQDYADLFDRLARLEANDPSETELYSEAGTIAKRLDSASRDLEKAGYEVEPEAE